MRHFISLLVLLVVTPVFGEELSYKPLTPERKETLQAFEESLEALDTLKETGVFTDEQHAERETELLTKAAEAAGSDSLTREQLSSLTVTMSDQVLGLFTFLNIVWVTAALLGVIAICWLFGLYFLAIVTMIPLRFWEVLIYLGCCALIASDLYFNFGMLLAFPGCVGLYAASWFSYLTRKNDGDANPLLDKRRLSRLTLDSFPHELVWSALTVVWSIVALVAGSHLVGFISVIAFMCTAGCMVGHSPGVLFVGFSKDDKIVQGTFAAFLCVLAYLFFGSHEIETPFDEGWAFLGTFFYFLGLLILGNKWYCVDYTHDDQEKTSWGHYIVMQVVMIVSGVAALYLGTVFDLPLLTGVGGTWFYIYILEKYYELPWEGKGWAWSLLGLSGLLYAFVVFARAYPQFFLWVG